MSRNIYAIFLDIDGTLLSRKGIPRRNIEAIEQVRKMGHKVFINTGRSYANIPWSILEDIQFDGVVAGIGSYVRYGNEVLWKAVFTEEQLTKLTAYYLASNTRCIMEGEEEIFCINLDDPRDRIVIDSNDAFSTLYKDSKISKVNVYGGMSPEAEKLMAGEYECWAHDDYYEFTTKGCNKAFGMKVILNHLSLGRENCIAMGDSKNDTDMLRYAGISVAMGNSTDDVKKLCDFVTDTSENAGVAAALEKLILRPADSWETKEGMDHFCEDQAVETA